MKKIVLLSVISLVLTSITTSCKKEVVAPTAPSQTQPQTIDTTSQLDGNWDVMSLEVMNISTQGDTTRVFQNFYDVDSIPAEYTPAPVVNVQGSTYETMNEIIKVGGVDYELFYWYNGNTPDGYYRYFIEVQKVNAVSGDIIYYALGKK